MIYFLWLINSLHFSRFSISGVRLRMSGGQWRIVSAFSGCVTEIKLKLRYPGILISGLLSDDSVFIQLWRRYAINPERS